MLEIRIIEKTKKELRKFVEFGVDLYKGNPYFVPPLISDDVNTLSPTFNPAFDFCDAEYFMAYRDGKPAGRIAAIIHRRGNEMHGTKTLRFGFVDFVDDDEGMLIEGFDELSTMATIYNYPYYPAHMERLGFTKSADWVEYNLKVPAEVPEKHQRITEIVKQKYGLRIVKYTSVKKAASEIGRPLFELINEAYADLFEFVKLSDRQIDHYVKYYIRLLRLDLLTTVRNSDDELVAIGVALPSMSRALQKSKGKMLPFGWYHLARALYLNQTDTVDLLLVAVKPEYQSKGVNALLFADLIPLFNKHGFKYAESNPELELNAKVQAQWQYFEPRQHKRRRCYIKNL